MKKLGFIFALHGVVFTLFTVLNMLINKHIYGFLSDAINYEWLVQLLDLVISGTLYVAIYFVVYLSYKFIVVHIKKEVISIKGTWYHVHLKRNQDGYVKTNVLRAGVTTVTQDLCDVQFNASNQSYIIGENGEITVESNVRKNTGWCSWSVDWNGKTDLVTCFKAYTQTKTGNEFTDRHGIHKLKINGDVMSGNFADQYPSANFGDIYFFRSEKDRDKFMLDFLQDGDIDSPIQ